MRALLNLISEHDGYVQSRWNLQPLSMKVDLFHSTGHPFCGRNGWIFSLCGLPAERSIGRRKCQDIFLVSSIIRLADSKRGTSCMIYSPLNLTFHNLRLNKIPKELKTAQHHIVRWLATKFAASYISKPCTMQSSLFSKGLEFIYCNSLLYFIGSIIEGQQSTILEAVTL